MSGTAWGSLRERLGTAPEVFSVSREASVPSVTGKDCIRVNHSIESLIKRLFQIQNFKDDFHEKLSPLRWGYRLRVC